MENDSLRKSPQFSAKHPQRMCRQITKSWLAKFPVVTLICAGAARRHRRQRLRGGGGPPQEPGRRYGKTRKEPVRFLSVPDFSKDHCFGSVRFGNCFFSGSMRFGLRFLNASWFDSVRSGSVRFVSASSSGRYEACYIMIKGCESF